MNCYLFIKDLLTFLLTVTGLVIAGMGLATWKKQIKGSKEFETAYNLHYSVLKMRNAIKHVRNPAIFSSESQKAVEYAKTKSPDESDGNIQKDSHSYVYEMRWEEINKASTEMESHLLAAEVLWGTEIMNLIKPLNQKIIELNIGLQQYFRPELRTKDSTQLHDIIYDKGNWATGQEDSFSKEVGQAVQGITDYIKNKIS